MSYVLPYESRRQILRLSTLLNIVLIGQAVCKLEYKQSRFGAENNYVGRFPGMPVSVCSAHATVFLRYE
jgi:hypothetical protein